MWVLIGLCMIGVASVASGQKSGSRTIVMTPVSLALVLAMSFGVGVASFDLGYISMILEDTYMKLGSHDGNSNTYVDDWFIFHGVNNKSYNFISCGATSENIAFVVHEMKGRDAWPDLTTGCLRSNPRQSPIDIGWDTMYDSSLTNFVLSGYDNVVYSSGNLINNGHTVQLNVANPSQTNMSGGGLNGTYYAAQLHYHWGEDDTYGSEHELKSGKFPMEVHLVHFKAEYDTLIDSLAHDDGLAVLGFMFYVDNSGDNERIAPLVNALDNIQYKGETVTLDMDFTGTMPFNIDSTDHLYYRYLGGLTTPACNEIVVWTVFENMIPISSAQLAKFRTLKQKNSTASNNYALTYNNRLPQPLHSRQVYRSFPEMLPPNFHWTYEGREGVDAWKVYYKSCNGKLQSPIDIPAVTSPHTAKYDAEAELHTLEFKGYDIPVTGRIKNNGHTIQVDVENTEPMYVWKGGLGEPGMNDKYRVAQFHFHWGRNNNEGSEHTHNGKKYPLEVHIVHYKEKYESLGRAVGYHDGLAVVGFWFEVGETNSNYNSIINALESVKYKDANVPISGFTLKEITFSDLLDTASNGRHHNFYRYQGGLTTPGCNEIVTWTVMAETVKISNAQLGKFREMLQIKSGPATMSSRIGWNYRFPQPLAGRVVKTSWNYMSDMPTDGSPITLQSLFTCIVFAIVGKLFS